MLLFLVLLLLSSLLFPLIFDNAEFPRRADNEEGEEEEDDVDDAVDGAEEHDEIFPQAASAERSW